MTLWHNGLSMKNALAYWAHMQVMKKMKCCEYCSRGIDYKPFLRRHIMLGVNESLQGTLTEREGSVQLTSLY